MKKIYIKPVMEIESFVTEEIMENFNPRNVLSYDGNSAGGYQDGSNFISFQNDPNNMLNSIDYSEFIQ